MAKKKTSRTPTPPITTTGSSLSRRHAREVNETEKKNQTGRHTPKGKKKPK